MLRFYWRWTKCTPLLLWRSLTGLDKVTGVLTLAFSAVGISAWQQWLPWWSPFAAFGALLLYGFLRENYEEYLKVEKDRDKTQAAQETEEKRVAVGTVLLQLYDRGMALRMEVMNSTDESPPSVWQDRLRLWREATLDYLEDNVSAGKAQYVDAVMSVKAVARSGMKSHTTLREKEVIVSHLEERLTRLADVMKEY